MPPDGGPFFPESLVRDEIDAVRLEDHETILRSVGEPSLYQLSSFEDVICVRLLWKPSLDPPVVIRAWRKDEAAWIRVSRPEGFVRDAAGLPHFEASAEIGMDSTYQVPDHSWNRLMAFSSDSGIWQPLTELQRAFGDSITDGENWVLEKIDNGEYSYNQFPKPRLDPVEVGETRSYRSTVELGEFLVSLLPEEPPEWKRYRGDPEAFGGVTPGSGPVDPFAPTRSEQGDGSNPPPGSR